MRREVKLLRSQERAAGCVLYWTDPVNVLARYFCILRLNIILQALWQKRCVSMMSPTCRVIRLTVRLWCSYCFVFVYLMSNEKRSWTWMMNRYELVRRWSVSILIFFLLFGGGNVHLEKLRKATKNISHDVLHLKPGVRSRYYDQATGWTVGISIPGRGKGSFFSPKRPDLLWRPHTLLLIGYRGSLPEVKLPGCDVHQWPPCSAEVKNEWNYVSAILLCLHGMERDSCTLFTFYHVIRLRLGAGN